jgi:predicted regulator of Ras-like GTPase activity (Roadblock/LC7/MglB family)
MTGDPSVEDRVWAELRQLRTTVSGVYGCLVATNDGLLIAQDVPGLEPAEIAALAATTRSLANRSVHVAERGQFREALSRGSEGYLAVYAAGANAVVAVVGTNDLNVAMLHYQARGIVERIAAHSAHFAKWGTAAGAQEAVSGHDLHAELNSDRHGLLPPRRTPASRDTVTSGWPSD